MGLGQYMRGVGHRIDDALVYQADARANAARAGEIAEIKANMQRNMGDPAVSQQVESAYIPGMDADAALQLAAESQRGVVGTPEGPSAFSIEGINDAMANDAAARYGYSALAAGGATATGSRDPDARS